VTSIYLKKKVVESGKFYGTVLDPILSSLRKRVALEIAANKTVIDIACGTGAQLFEIAEKSTKVTGVDLSESMIDFAIKTSDQRGISNAEFHVCDATDLSVFRDYTFDIALLSLALHQFSPDLHPLILNEMKRVANTIILLDYAVPLPKNYVGFGSRVAEFLAGREHNRNFKKYYKLGGLNTILPANNLQITKTRFLAKGAFQLVVAEYS
jgi:ubiquinone/menaquinone biosynthesis C-methylase UbiE